MIKQNTSSTKDYGKNEKGAKTIWKYTYEEGLKPGEEEILVEL